LDDHVYGRVHVHFRRNHGWHTVFDIYKYSSEFQKKIITYTAIRILLLKLLFQVKMRTLRIGVLNLSLTIGISFGIALSGILYQKLGFYGIYSICSTLYFLGILYGFFYLKDVKNNNTQAVCEDNKFDKKQSFSINVKEFFDLIHIKNAFKVTFKKGNNNRRLRLLMMMVVLMIIMGPMTG